MQFEEGNLQSKVFEVKRVESSVYYEKCKHCAVKGVDPYGREVIVPPVCIEAPADDPYCTCTLCIHCVKEAIEKWEATQGV